MDHAFEAGPLAAEFLRPLRFAPDGGVFEFPEDLGQAFTAPVVVKDTP
jgi:hypothetical protein